MSDNKIELKDLSCTSCPESKPISERIEIIILRKLDENSTQIEKLSASISKVSTDLDELKSDTKDVVQINKDLKAVGRIGTLIRKILTALSGLAVIGVLANYALEYFNKLGN